MARVSVIIPVFNHEKYIAECIESVLSQTYKDFEIVVVDDGSTDKTPEILKKYARKIEVIRQQNKGGAAALNTAIENSTGEYIAWLSSDDIFMPSKLKEQIGFFEKNPGIDAVYTDFYIIDGNGLVIKEVRSPFYPEKKDFLYNLLIVNFINGSSVMFKRTCIETTGYFDEDMKYHADGNMWFRMLKHFKFRHISKLLLKYRWHTSNLSHHFFQMKRYLYLYYRKIFEIYSVDDFFQPGTSIDEAYFKIAEILFERRRFYSLAFLKLMDGIKVQPLRLHGYKLMFSFLFRLPLKLIIEIFLWARTVKQRYSGNR